MRYALYFVRYGVQSLPDTKPSEVLIRSLNVIAPLEPRVAKKLIDDMICGELLEDQILLWTSQTPTTGVDRIWVEA